MSAIDTMSPERVHGGGSAKTFLRRVASALTAYYLGRRELRRTRVRLFDLTDSELRDIGLTRELAEREASRSLLACYLNNAR